MKTKANGIKGLNISSNVSELVIQYKLEMKQPKPNIHTILKDLTLYLVNFNNIHKKTGYEKKLRQNKL